MTDLATLADTLRRAAVETPASELPALIGTLEATKAAAWARLSPPAVTVQQTPGRSLTAAEIAAALNVPQSWVYELARQGRLPCRRLGRYVRFDLAAVEGALASDSKTANLGTEKNRRKVARLNRAATTLLPPQPAVESLP